MRNKAELAALAEMLERRGATVLTLTEAITSQATGLMEALTLSHGLQMGDALIAATAQEHRLPLLTGNIKYFAAIEGLIIHGISI